MGEFFGTSTPTISVSISPTSATLASGGTQQFSATVAGTTNTGVTWTATKGTVSSTGLYTAPTVSVNTSATVKVTSVADSTKSLHCRRPTRISPSLSHRCLKQLSAGQQPNTR